MTNDSNLQIRLDQIAEDFLSRRRKGESPSAAEYQRQYPELSGEIQDLLATLAIVAEFDAGDEETFKGHLDDSVDDSPAPLEVGPYKIVSTLGQGGMGTVYRARQSEPVKREVAVKVIRAGAGSKKILERFNAERQAVAMMDHPNIAKVLDAGAANTGSPYFVMELVDGKTITEYCDQQKLGIPQRLELFLQVCNAVQHAHQKGIIHRDLKPGNILVGSYDGVATPKVIDFGLAKALDQAHQIQEKSRLTQFGNIVGTLRYMSPEQAGMDALDVDTRTDIYSLGVVLYELLTGTTPVESETEASRPILKVLDMVLNKEPQRPSDRLSSSGDSVSSITEQRKTNSSKLQSILRGELDWVVMKALEKNRDRRYESAAAFASDIGRYLSGDVVQARPPSASYRVSKFVGKNRGLVAAVSTVAALLVAGIAGTSYGLFKANHSAKQARIAKQDALDKKALADRRAREAETSQTRTNDVLNLVTGAFESVNPDFGADADISARELLLQVEETLNSSTLDEQGRLQLLSTLTKSYIAIGEQASALSAAEEFYRLANEVHGDNNEQTFESRNLLARVYTETGKPEDAISLFERNLQIVEDNPDSTARALIGARQNMANAFFEGGQRQEALAILEESVPFARENLGTKDRDYLDGLSALALCHQRLGHLKQAIPMFEEVLQTYTEQFGDDHPDTLDSMNRLAIALAENGDVEEALALHEKNVEVMVRRLGEDHPKSINAKTSLVSAYYSTQQIEKAIELGESVQAEIHAKFGEEHPLNLGTSNILALAYKRLGQFEESTQIQRELVALSVSIYGKDNIETIDAIGNLANHLAAGGQHAEALEMYEENLQRCRKSLGDEHPRTIFDLENLAILYASIGQFKKARPMMDEVLQRNTKLYGEGHKKLFHIKQKLAATYQRLGRLEEAIVMLEQLTNQMEEQQISSTDPISLVANQSLAQAYMEDNRYEEGVPLMEQTLGLFRKSLGDDSPYTLSVMAHFSVHLTKGKRFERAETLLKEILETQKRDNPEAWMTFEASSQYGGVLLSLGRLDEAEARLIEAYEGFQRLETPLGRGPSKKTAVRRLQEIAELKEDEESAKQWQQRLEDLESSEK